MKIFIIALLSLFVTTTYAKTINRNDLDILGVVLGMSPQEATTVITKKLGISESELKKEKGSFDDDISFRYKSPLRQIMIHFINSTPLEDKNNYVVQLIIYKIHSNDANKKAIKERAFEKYGEPSGSRYAFSWCDNPTRSFDYKNGDERMQCSGFGSSINFSLRLSGTELRLEDYAIIRQLKKESEEKNKVKIIF